jgi:hypothetical protein
MSYANYIHRKIYQNKFYIKTIPVKKHPAICKQADLLSKF